MRPVPIIKQWRFKEDKPPKGIKYTNTEGDILMTMSRSDGDMLLFQIIFALIPTGVLIYHWAYGDYSFGASYLFTFGFIIWIIANITAKLKVRIANSKLFIQTGIFGTSKFEFPLAEIRKAHIRPRSTNGRSLGGFSGMTSTGANIEEFVIAMNSYREQVVMTMVPNIAKRYFAHVIEEHLKNYRQSNESNLHVNYKSN